MSAAFLETGRGLFIGAGMTGLVQAVIATITYFALGLPRALVLDLHPFVTLISMFGALVLVGPWGIVLGPLVARLTLEVIWIAQKERVL